MLIFSEKSNNKNGKRFIKGTQLINNAAYKQKFILYISENVYL